MKNSQQPQKPTKRNKLMNQSHTFRIAAVAAVAAVSLAIFSSPVHATLSPLVTSVTPITVTTGGGYNVGSGMEFTAPAGLQVTALGLYFNTGDSLTHHLALARVDTEGIGVTVGSATILGTVDVTMTGTGLNGGFQYGNLLTPVPLQAGQHYLLLGEFLMDPAEPYLLNGNFSQILAT